MRAQILGEFPSSSSSAVYAVQLNASGLLSCNCPGWTVKRVGKPRHCKHTRQIEVSQKLVLMERDGQMFVAQRPGVDVGSFPPEALKAVTPAPTQAVPGASGSDLPQTPPEAKPAPTGFVAPMLASKMPTGSNADSFSADEYVAEEKFDGIRLVVRVQGGQTTAWSRLENVRSLPDRIRVAMQKLPDGFYDGELCIVGGRSFDVAAGANNGTEVYVLYDMIEVMGQSVMDDPLTTRREYLEMAMSVTRGMPGMALAEQFAPGSAEVQRIWDRGGEGIVIKRKKSAYRPGWRTPDWAKVKRVSAATLTITGFKAGESGEFSSLKLVTEDGIETTVKTPNAVTMREIMASPAAIVGRKVVISYQERTPAGSFRHPMFDHWLGEAEKP